MPLRVDIIVQGRAQVTVRRQPARSGGDPRRPVRAEERRQRGYSEDEWRERNLAWYALQKAETALAEMEFDGPNGRWVALRRKLNDAWQRHNERWAD